MKRTFHFLAILAVQTSLLASCAPTRKFRDSQAALQSARNDSARLAAQVAQQNATIGALKQQVSDLNSKVDDLNNRAGILSSDAASKQSQLNKSKEQLAER